MTARRVEELFELALRSDAGERPAALARACGEMSLRAEVDDLLACDEAASRAGFLAPPDGPDEPVPSLICRRVGPYLIRESLAVGGMGRVYRATRVDDYRQEVAVKFVKAGGETDELLERFRNERQVLAALSHPHIARLLDGGVTADGAPYLVMEYIPGLSLHRYCDAHRLDTAGRLRLFRLVCLAVDYAHRQAVVHRDLKPDNVLVTADGTPKVTDFGLAKSTDRAAGPHPSLTETGSVLGSPSYMAPEQARGAGQVGPAVDVYGLGAILYELLTGRPPFRAATPVETLVQVLHDDPVPPRQLDRSLPRDLETICLKCLHKDTRRRYPTTAELADDIGRFLAGEPVRARPVTRAERLWRQCRRRPLVAGLAATLALTLAGGFASTLALWLEAERHAADMLEEREDAKRQRDHAQAAADFLYECVADNWLTADQRLLKTQRKLLQQALGYYRERARETDERGVRHRTAQAYYQLGKLDAMRGDGPESVKAHEQAIALWEQLAREDPGDPRYPLGLFHARLALCTSLGLAGRLDEVPGMEQRALPYAEDLARRFPEAKHRDLLAAHYKTLGLRAYCEGRYAAAEDLCRQGLAIATELTENHPSGMYGRNVARNLQVLSEVYRYTGRPAEALDALRACVRAGEATTGGSDVAPFEQAMFRMEVGMYRYYLGEMFEGAGRSTEARPHLEEAAAVTGKLAADYPDHYYCRLNSVVCLGGLGYAHHRAGRAAEAREVYGRYVRALERLIADFPSRAADARERLAGALCICPVESLRDGPRALALFEEALGREPTIREHKFLLGMARYRAGDVAGSLAGLEQGLTGGPGERAQAAFFLCLAHHRLGQHAQARELYRRAVDGMGPLPTHDLVCLREEADQVLSPDIKRVR